MLRLYEQAFGDLERERQKLALQSSELFRRVELLSIKVARGEQLTPDVVSLINQVVDAEYARFRRRLRADITSRSNAPTVADDDDRELVKMYRVLAKRLHPDAAGSQDEIDAWHRAQRAYLDKDASRLRALLAVLDVEEPDSTVMDTWSLERWQLEETRLAARRRLEERKLNKLRTEEPYSLATVLDDTEWVKQHRKDLELDINARKVEVNEHSRLYAELTAGLVPSGEDAIKTAEQRSFDEDFFDNTYFGGR